MDWRWRRRKVSWYNWGPFLEFSWKIWGKAPKTSFLIIGVMTDIRIGHFQNSSHKRNRLIQFRPSGWFCKELRRHGNGLFSCIIPLLASRKSWKPHMSVMRLLNEISVVAFSRHFRKSTWYYVSSVKWCEAEFRAAHDFSRHFVKKRCNEIV
jgi:hypothetical protein